MKAVLWDKPPNLCGFYANFALLVSYLNRILGHRCLRIEDLGDVWNITHLVSEKKTSQGWTCQWPQECQKTQGLNEPIRGDTRNAFRTVIPWNERINASLWLTVEIMGREETRAMSVTTDPYGVLANPAQGRDAPSHSFLTGTSESATIL